MISLEELPPGLPEDFSAVARFHGHCCNGLLMGYRAASEALIESLTPEDCSL